MTCVPSRFTCVTSEPIQADLRHSLGGNFVLVLENSASEPKLVVQERFAAACRVPSSGPSALGTEPEGQRDRLDQRRLTDTVVADEDGQWA